MVQRHRQKAANPSLALMGQEHFALLLKDAPNYLH